VQATSAFDTFYRTGILAGSQFTVSPMEVGELFTKTNQAESGWRVQGRDSCAIPIVAMLL
jgi:hypothetical protein